MPTIRASDHSADTDTGLSHALSVLQHSLTRSGVTPDDLFAVLKPLQDDNASKSHVIETICELIAPKYQTRIDFDVLLASFWSKHKLFDYTAFHKAFENHRRNKSNSNRPSSPTKRSSSPNKHSQQRTNWLLEQQQHQNTASDFEDNNGEDITKRSIRVDERLETQRLLLQSIRHKLLSGVVGAQYSGFLGVQETLFQLDTTGEGYLEGKILESHVLSRLKKPFTKAETKFLMANIRPMVSKTQEKHTHVVDYEQIATLCNLDSDVSADEDCEHVDHDHRSSPRRPADGAALLGADFLAAERRLCAFLCQPLTTNKQEQTDTPRTVLTGAERFLERAEQLDTEQCGALSEQSYYQILKHECGLELSMTLLCSLLARITRTTDGKVNYTTFLERYGQNPRMTRDRRKLKRFLSTLLIRLPSTISATDWIRYLTQRMKKYDLRVHHQRKCGEIPTEEFLHVLRGKTGPVQVSVVDATEALNLYLRVSPTSAPHAIDYRSFLTILQDCHLQALAIPSTSPDNDNSTTQTPPSRGNVADYLISHASMQERQHFETFMDMLHRLQQKIRTSTSTYGSRPHGNHANARNTDNGGAVSRKEPQFVAGELTSIENGVAMALGNGLSVRIQFATTNTPMN